MHPDPKELIIKVLTIVGCTKGVDVEAAKFICLCHYRACEDLISSLPGSVRGEVEVKLDNLTNPKMIKTILSRWYSDTDYTAALRKAARGVCKEFLGKFVPSMPLEKRRELCSLLGT